MTDRRSTRYPICGAVWSSGPLAGRQCVLPPHHAGDHAADERTPCECEHPAILDDGRWSALALVGFQPATGDPEGPLLELRDCSRCGSTRARPVPSLRYLVRTVNHYIRLRRAMGALAVREVPLRARER